MLAVVSKEFHQRRMIRRKNLSLLIGGGRNRDLLVAQVRLICARLAQECGDLDRIAPLLTSLSSRERTIGRMDSSSFSPPLPFSLKKKKSPPFVSCEV